MSAKIYDSSQGLFVESSTPKVFDGTQFADSSGKYQDSGGIWQDAWSTGVALTVGTVYTLNGTTTTANAPIKAVCVQMDETNKTAVMQSYGFGHGTGTYATLSASSYGTNTGSFTISNIKLPTGTSRSDIAANGVADPSSAIFTALQTAAVNHSSFGASDDGAWLGTFTGGGFYHVSTAGYVNFSGYNFNRVIAPCFILNLSNVKMDGTTLIAL